MPSAAKSGSLTNVGFEQGEAGLEPAAAQIGAALVRKLSMHSTVAPASSRRAQRWRPMKPGTAGDGDVLAGKISLVRSRFIPVLGDEGRADGSFGGQGHGLNQRLPAPCDGLGLVVMAAHPVDAFSTRSLMSAADRDVVFPGHQAVIPPLAVAIGAGDLEYAAAEMQANDQVGPGIGPAIDVDGELVAQPFGFGRGCPASRECPKTSSGLRGLMVAPTDLASTPGRIASSMQRRGAG